jgi:hypothetical protein
MLNNSSLLNSLAYLNQVIINPGETYTVYFQLVDLDQPRVANAPGQRYIPVSGSTLSVQLNSINQANVITKIPSNPFADDRSIWSFNLSAAETAIAAGVNMNVTLTEGSLIRIARAEAVIIIGPTSVFSC